MEVSIESFELPRLSFYLSLKLTILSKVPGSYIMFLESLIFRSNQLKRRQRRWKLPLKSTPRNKSLKATLNLSAYEGSSVENFFASERLLPWKQPQAICFFLTLLVRDGRMKKGTWSPFYSFNIICLLQYDRSSYKAGKTLYQVSCSFIKDRRGWKLLAVNQGAGAGCVHIQETKMLHFLVQLATPLIKKKRIQIW